ncbi:hypothetical protein IFT58_13805 [Stenotrophomonas sp. CFBP 13718]|nr:hypothetical protein [Stenotrophomonas sp. CFBP 13718]
MAEDTRARPSSVPRTVSDHGLPPLPEPSGSAIRGGSYGTLPPEAKVVLEQLDCKVGNPTTAKVFQIPGQDGKTDFMVTDRSDSRFHYWIRSFAGTGGTTGYLAQLNGCPAWTVGMRAYIAKDGGVPDDVTATILARGGFPDQKAMKKYVDQGASELFAQFEKLGRVPLVRWYAEADPDRGLRTDRRTFGRGNYVHGGFLVWTGEDFEVKQKVSAALWLCENPKAPECIDDPFLEGP